MEFTRDVWTTVLGSKLAMIVPTKVTDPSAPTSTIQVYEYYPQLKAAFPFDAENNFNPLVAIMPWQVCCGAVVLCCGAALLLCFALLCCFTLLCTPCSVRRA